MPYLGQDIVSNRETIWTIIFGDGRKIELATLDIGTPSFANAAELLRNRRGEAHGYRFGESGGGTFTLKLEKYEYDQCFGPYDMAGVKLYKVPFTLVGKLPMNDANEDGVEVASYGAERSITFASCRRTGNKDDDHSTDANLTVSVPCSFLKSKELVPLTT